MTMLRIFNHPQWGPTFSDVGIRRCSPLDNTVALVDVWLEMHSTSLQPSFDKCLCNILTLFVVFRFCSHHLDFFVSTSEGYGYLHYDYG